MNVSEDYKIGFEEGVRKGFDLIWPPYDLIDILDWSEELARKRPWKSQDEWRALLEEALK